jgi:methylmalonyl-CoA mutase cobalamin-binding domain/chain
VDMIGISFMSGGQVSVTTGLMAELRRSGAADISVVVGGTIRRFDVPQLEAAGVQRIFRGGETLESVVEAYGSLARRVAER